MHDDSKNGYMHLTVEMRQFHATVDCAVVSTAAAQCIAHTRIWSGIVEIRNEVK